MSDTGEELTEEETDVSIHDISTSPKHVSFFADDTLFFPLGRDVEIAFLAGGPRATKRVTPLSEDGSEGDTQSYKLKTVLEEVGRVRIAPHLATTLALNILARQAKDDQFDKEGLEEHFNTIIDLIPDDSDDQQEMIIE